MKPIDISNASIKSRMFTMRPAVQAHMAAVLLLLSNATHSTIGTVDPLSELKNDGNRVVYCYYAFTLQIHRAARGSNQSEILALLQPLKEWESGIKRRYPDKRALSAKVVKAQQHFESQLESFVGQSNSVALDPEVELIRRSELACRDELAKLADYVAPAKAIQAPIKKTTPSNVFAMAAPKKPKYVVASGANSVLKSSPFQKGVFNPEWKGDLLWSKSGTKTKIVVSSFDEIPTFALDPRIHANARSFGGEDRAYCVGHMVEDDRSADGLTLYLKPAEDAGCLESGNVVSLHATAPDSIRMELHHDNSIIAAGDLWPHNRGKLLAMPASPNKVTPDPVKPKKAATARPVTVLPQAAVASSGVRAEPCAVCLPIDGNTLTKVGSPYTSGFFDIPWGGRFHWEWHQVDHYPVQATGVLKKKGGSGKNNSPLVLQLDYTSKYSDICVGDLREIGRSVGGSIIHFSVEPAAQKSCNPRVTHAYLYPNLSRVSSDPLLRLVLYADSKLISGGFLSAPKDSSIKIRVEPKIAMQATDAIQGLKRLAINDRKQKKGITFRSSAVYPDIKPLYEACIRYQPDIFAVVQREPYCQCVSEKVGIGGRVAKAALDGYVQDFAKLVARLHGANTKNNKLYYRLGEACRNCSSSDYELEPYCSGPDRLLYAATDYEQMIRLLESDAPKIEATDFYKKVFYRTYLQGYSAFCADRIQDPVPFVYSVTETTIGGWNNGNVNEVARSETLVERKYAASYGRFYDETKKSGNVNVGQASRSTGQGIRRMIGDAKAMLDTQRENRNAISQHLGQGCDSNAVVDAYSKLLTLVN